MLQFKVEDMTCNHCVGAVTRAIKEAAPDSKVEIELEQHTVRVQTQADARTVSEAIAQAGYTPVPD